MGFTLVCIGFVRFRFRMRQIANRTKKGLHRVCLGLSTICIGFVNDVKLDAPLSYFEHFLVHRFVYFYIGFVRSLTILYYPLSEYVSRAELRDLHRLFALSYVSQLFAPCYIYPGLFTPVYLPQATYPG